MALLLEKKLEKFAHLRIVFDDQDFAGAMNIVGYSVVAAVAIVKSPLRSFMRRLLDLDRKERAFVRTRADAHLVIQQSTQALHDREP